jgi:hypothetical protein
MLDTKNDFWYYNFNNLVNSNNIIPVHSMDSNEQLNSLSRFVILTTLFLIPFSIQLSIVFFICSVFFVLLVFNITPPSENKHLIENFELKKDLKHKYNNRNNKNNMTVKYSGDQNKKLNVQYSDNTKFNEYNYITPMSQQKCVETASCAKIPSIYSQIDPNENFYSVNQALAGPPSKRTLIAPVSVAPISDETWRANNLATRSQINTETNVDESRSGYLISEETMACGDSCGQVCCDGVDKVNCRLIESQLLPRRVKTVSENIGKTLIENFELPNKTDTLKPEVYNYPYEKQNKPTSYEVSDAHYSGQVLMSDGYHPEQIFENNLPSNLSVGKCAKNQVFNEYNKNIFTSNLQPDVYTRNQIIEPISSNIGISFTQQFEPISVQKDKNGVTFIGHDPNVREFPKQEDQDLLPYDRLTHISDIYDPRFTGYGTGYRSYIEPVTGQPRFYYDDVDAHKRPSYISRSNVDFIPSSLSTQAIPSMDYFKEQNKYSRSIADKQFLDDGIGFRTELQERLMRKSNAIMEQKRRFPKHTNDFNRGGMRRR